MNIVLAVIMCTLLLASAVCRSPARSEEPMIRRVDEVDKERNARLRVGMTYAEIVDALGEPDYNMGHGNIIAGWRLEKDRWFVPTFEGDVVTVMEFTNDLSGIPRRSSPAGADG